MHVVLQVNQYGPALESSNHVACVLSHSLNMHEQLSNGTTGLYFGQSFYIPVYFANENSALLFSYAIYLRNKFNFCKVHGITVYSCV